MKKAIVTGANGFVGAAVVKELVKQGVAVTAVIRNESSDLQRLKEIEGITYVFCPLNQLKTLPSLLTERDFDLFYHFAWDGAAGEARANTQLQLQNAQWTVDAVEVAHELSCKKIVVSGSIMEHETVSACYTQGNAPGIAYVYGSGKLVAHTMSSCVAAKLGIELVWGKITNAYGAGEFSPRFINSTIRKVLDGEDPQFTSGTQNYDFIYIDDVARAFYHLGTEGKSEHHYLIGSGHAKPLKEFILEMKEAIGQNVNFIFGDVPFTGVNLPLDLFSTEQITKDTSFSPEISFHEGILKTATWIKEIDV
ncbi:MAG: NAD-dependent epimerase/dehydratase family protein [Eubacteriales bacterium]